MCQFTVDVLSLAVPSINNLIVLRRKFPKLVLIWMLWEVCDYLTSIRIQKVIAFNKWGFKFWYLQNGFIFHRIYSIIFSTVVPVFQAITAVCTGMVEDGLVLPFGDLLNEALLGCVVGLSSTNWSIPSSSSSMCKGCPSGCLVGDLTKRVFFSLSLAGDCSLRDAVGLDSCRYFWTELSRFFMIRSASCAKWFAKFQ